MSLTNNFDDISQLYNLFHPEINCDFCRCIIPPGAEKHFLQHQQKTVCKQCIETKSFTVPKLHKKRKRRNFNSIVSDNIEDNRDFLSVFRPFDESSNHSSADSYNNSSDDGSSNDFSNIDNDNKDSLPHNSVARILQEFDDESSNASSVVTDHTVSHT